MIKIYSCLLFFLLLLLPMQSSFAQARPWPGAFKVFSGYLHTYRYKTKAPFWHVILSPFFPKQEEVIRDWQCFILFKSPTAIDTQSVTEVPKDLTYYIKFKQGTGLALNESMRENDLFKKVTIKIYTDDEQDYTLDSGTGGDSIGVESSHRIYDPYFIYLILSSKIDHIDVLSASGKTVDKYVLDKFNVHNNK